LRHVLQFRGRLIAIPGVRQGGLQFRQSLPYLARKKAFLMDQPGEIEYFAGLDWEGNPHFSESESDAVPLFRDYDGNNFTPTNCANVIFELTASIAPPVPWTTFGDEVGRLRRSAGRLQPSAGETRLFVVTLNTSYNFLAAHLHRIEPRNPSAMEGVSRERPALHADPKTRTRGRLLSAHFRRNDALKICKRHPKRMRRVERSRKPWCTDLE